MSIRKIINTKKEGRLRFMIYPSGKEYVAACIDLGIIREGKNPIILMKRVEKVAMQYLTTVAKHNMSDDLLNQKLDKEYMDKYREISSRERLARMAKKEIAQKKSEQESFTWDSKAWESKGKRVLAIA
jgi:hypothetical protein